MFPQSIQKLINLFSKFPTVGPRTASRFVFYLLKLPKEEVEILTGSILNLKNIIKICKFCFNPFEPVKVENPEEFCEICSNPSRDKNLLCIVEKETDLISLEKTKKYQGLYFILGGTVSALKKEDVKKLKIQELEERIRYPEKFGIKNQFKEIIIAVNPTAEGETTALYLERIIKKLLALPESEHGFKGRVTRLGKGLPIGGELEYADEETLSSALEGRK